ncbi:MAG: hypothetical protein LBM99_05220 [Bacillales bacterium]|jgi:hypothetical protein|nr:hypothetical protein [Bacillales bacterium]
MKLRKILSLLLLVGVVGCGRTPSSSSVPTSSAGVSSEVVSSSAGNSSEDVVSSSEPQVNRAWAHAVLEAWADFWPTFTLPEVVPTATVFEYDIYDADEDFGSEVDVVYQNFTLDTEAYEAVLEADGWTIGTVEVEEEIIFDLIGASKTFDGVEVNLQAGYIEGYIAEGACIFSVFDFETVEEEQYDLMVEFTFEDLPVSTSYAHYTNTSPIPGCAFREVYNKADAKDIAGLESAPALEQAGVLRFRTNNAAALEDGVYSAFMKNTAPFGSGVSKIEFDAKYYNQYGDSKLVIFTSEDGVTYDEGIEVELLPASATFDSWDHFVVELETSAPYIKISAIGTAETPSYNSSINLDNLQFFKLK